MKRAQTILLRYLFENYLNRRRDGAVDAFLHQAFSEGGLAEEDEVQERLEAWDALCSSVACHALEAIAAKEGK